MKVILTENVDNLGLAGEVVNVKPGYGRNFLIPQSKAVLATPGALRNLETQRDALQKRAQEAVEAAKELAKNLEKARVVIAMKVGEENKIFGSVTTRQIADLLHEQGFEIDRRKVVIQEEIKTLGDYHAVVELLGDIKPTVTVTVVAEEE